MQAPLMANQYNHWLNQINVRKFAKKVQKLIQERFGTSEIRYLTLQQFHSIADDIKKYHRECGRPRIARLSDIDDV